MPGQIMTTGSSSSVSLVPWSFLIITSCSWVFGQQPTSGSRLLLIRVDPSNRGFVPSHLTWVLHVVSGCSQEFTYIGWFGLDLRCYLLSSVAYQATLKSQWFVISELMYWLSSGGCSFVHMVLVGVLLVTWFSWVHSQGGPSILDGLSPMSGSWCWLSWVLLFSSMWHLILQGLSLCGVSQAK